jgi:hypothetical protein
MSQHDMEILYIYEKDNCIADALSQLPLGAFPNKSSLTEPLHIKWGCFNTVLAVLNIVMDSSMLNSIQKGYEEDAFCKKLTFSHPNMPGVTFSNSLWYDRSRLIILCVSNICENLFRLAHDSYY